jgi:hypothetical protein
MIRIFDFRPPSVSIMLPRSPVGSGFRQIWQFRGFNGSGEENLAKVSGGICPDGCPLQLGVMNDLVLKSLPILYV